MNTSGILTAIGGGSGVIAVAYAAMEAIFGRHSRRAEAAAQVARAETEKHDRWFKEAAEAYERLEGECLGCKGELRRVSNAFHGLLDDLDGLDGTDVFTLKAQVRSAARRARAASAWEGL